MLRITARIIWMILLAAAVTLSIGAIRTEDSAMHALPPPPNGNGKTVARAEEASAYVREKMEKRSDRAVQWSSINLWNSFRDKSSAAFTATIHPGRPALRFAIKGVFKEDAFTPSEFIIYGGPDNKIIQTLKARDRFDNWGAGWMVSDLALADIVQLVDINFDGYIDIRLLWNTGATGNNWYSTYLYDPSKGRFVYHKALSSLSGVYVDGRKKLIKTYTRGGWCAECIEHFKIGRNQLRLMKFEWTESERKNDESVCYRYTGMPRHMNTAYLGYTFFDNFADPGFHAFIRKKMKRIKKEELAGSLDGRERGVFGMVLE